MNKRQLDKSSEKDVLSFTSKNFNPDIYAEVAKAAKLCDVRMKDCVYTSKPELFMRAESEGAAFKQGFSGHPSGMNFDQDDGYLLGSYSWKAEVKFGKKIGLSMKADYILFYEGFSGMNPDYVRLYFEKISRFTTYPFFRSHFALQSSASGITLAPLPSLSDRVD